MPLCLIPLFCRMLVMLPKQRSTPVWMPRSTSSCSWLITTGWLRCREAPLHWLLVIIWLTWLLFWTAPSLSSPTFLLVHTHTHQKTEQHVITMIVTIAIIIYFIKKIKSMSCCSAASSILITIYTDLFNFNVSSMFVYSVLQLFV